MDGILNIYKESGYTSFDVVAKLRRILNQKKIGHTGTLDPAAIGVLPVCVGKATKLCSLLTDGTKTYETVLLLGTITDTLDMEGQVIKTCPVECTNTEAERCVMSFLGEQEQIPPMYSALKVNGKRLYDLARAGVTVERKPRKVVFYELDILEINLPRIRLRVKCSKGTYIRSLCNDIGEALGCGGCMEKLIRTGSGGFSIESALTLSEVEKLMEAGGIEKALIPVDKIFENIPKAVTLPEFDKTVRNGGKIARAAFDSHSRSEAGKGDVRLYDSEGTFIGIYSFMPESDMFRPKKIFY
ncbi:MAG TPA: tRNA pseudouridine(55) synthase TruB [Candidatus Alectryocaccobium stercorigallinarum]|nr:tRNA pseudouridine(55) synthase TruB [Candidatus Alectryocaccobium stercorigallinarum]